MNKRVLLTDDLGVSMCGVFTGKVGQRGRYKDHVWLRFAGRTPQVNGQRGREQAVPQSWFKLVSGGHPVRAYEYRARRPRKD